MSTTASDPSATDPFKYSSAHSALVFVVGMPRSGTKLLRDLLNRHDDLAIFPNESHFIPYFQRRFGLRTDFEDTEVFHEFFRQFQRTTFYRRLKDRGIVISEIVWREHLTGGRFTDVLRALFACYRTMAGVSIVGDKTPEYITQVPILSELFPDARFIHIVRDPRDYALSIRKAWHKNMARAVQRWKRHIRKYQNDVAAKSVAQITVRYEDLLSAPRDVLSSICGFLGMKFQPQMMSLDAPSEELGDARYLNTILQDNTNKWTFSMASKDLRDIELIAGAMMSEFGYEPVIVAGDEDLNRLRELYYRAIDAVHLFRFRFRVEGGVMPAIGETWRAFRHSGVDE